MMNSFADVPEDVLNLVFLIDSILTAVGMTEHLPVMVISVVVAVLVMLLAAESLAKFIRDNPARCDSDIRVAFDEWPLPGKCAFVSECPPKALITRSALL